MRKLLFLLAFCISALAQAQQGAANIRQPKTATYRAINTASLIGGDFNTPFHSTALCGPQAYYSNGNTYFTTAEKTGGLSRQGNIYRYNHDAKTLTGPTRLGIINPGQTDNHQIPSVIAFNDTVVTAEENGHQTYISIKRSNSLGASYSQVSTIGTVQNVPNAVATSAFGYPTPYRKGSDLYMFVRYQYNEGSYFKSTDRGTTWGSKVAICTMNPAGYTPPGGFYYNTNYWNYFSLVAPGSDGRCHYFVSLRNADGSFNAPVVQVYYLYSDDMVTWKNVSGSFSKNVSVSGKVTREEMDANCVWEPTTGVTDDYVIFEAGVVAGGEVHTICKSSGTNYKYIKSSGGSIVRKLLPFTDIDLRERKGIWVNPSNTNEVQVWGTVNDNVTGKPQAARWQTTDGGDNWTLMETLPGQNSNAVHYPVFSTWNAQDAPETLILAPSIYSSVDSDIYMSVFQP